MGSNNSYKSRIRNGTDTKSLTRPVPSAVTFYAQMHNCNFMGKTCNSDGLEQPDNQDMTESLVIDLALTSVTTSVV
jgi:hypothetical protein